MGNYKELRWWMRRCPECHEKIYWLGDGEPQKAYTFFWVRRCLNEKCSLVIYNNQEHDRLIKAGAIAVMYTGEPRILFTRKTIFHTPQRVFLDEGDDVNERIKQTLL